MPSDMSQTKLNMQAMMSDAFQNDVTLFVNSSDGFADCWHPFFRLLDLHWPEHGPALLNTEKAFWLDAPSYVRSSQVALGEAERLTWSECVIRGLQQITTPLVLYFQEDYFLERPVRHAVIEQAAAAMLADPSIGHIALTQHGSLPPFEPYPDPAYEKIGQKARYRISTQAGLWRKDVLLSYLIPVENGWMFEILGTMRAQRRKDLFLVARFDESAGGPAIAYTHTGIIKGQWHPAMPDLFARHGLEMDFSKRGFYVPPAPLFAKIAVARKLAKQPGHVLRQVFAGS
jgi:hypothetical protein